MIDMCHYIVYEPARWPSRAPQNALKETHCLTGCPETVSWDAQGSNAHVVAEVMSEDVVSPVHEVLQLPWRRARAWCLPPLHLLLHTVASAASVCQFVAPASHPSLAVLHGFSVGGAACLPPAVALEVRTFAWGL